MIKWDKLIINSDFCCYSCQRKHLQANKSNETITREEKYKQTCLKKYRSRKYFSITIN